jgi:hypothetical protein
MSHFRKLSSAGLPAIAAGICLAAPGVAKAAADDENDSGTDWTRNFRLGAVVALNIKANFSVNGAFTPSGRNPGPAGDPGKLADHQYDDGYVRVDKTGNAAGYTTFWGYSSASQYDPVAQTLTFHGTQSFTASGGGQRDDAPYLGVEMAYGGKIVDWSGTRIGWQVGFGWLPVKISDTQALPGSFVQTVHQYSAPGITLPQPPYNGGSSGIGPAILDLPTAGPVQTVSGVVTGSRTVEATVYSLKIGPSFSSQFNQRFGMELGLGFMLGVVDGEYKFDELLVPQNGTPVGFSGSSGKLDFDYTGYADVLFYYHTSENADLYVGFQYSPLGASALGVSGQKADLNLGGALYLMAGLHWSF